jgi:hypothetical protein
MNTRVRYGLGIRTTRNGISPTRLRRRKMGRTAISSNHFSHDIQVKDAVSYMNKAAKEEFNAAFPEFDELIWEGSWVHAQKSGVDVEYMSWACDWIEAMTEIYWEDGEPWVNE